MEDTLRPRLRRDNECGTPILVIPRLPRGLLVEKQTRSSRLLPGI